MVNGKDSQLSGCGFESQHSILYGVSQACFYIGKRNNGSQMGHTKKYFFKVFTFGSVKCIYKGSKICGRSYFSKTNPQTEFFNPRIHYPKNNPNPWICKTKPGEHDSLIQFPQP